MEDGRTRFSRIHLLCTSPKKGKSFLIIFSLQVDLIKVTLQKHTKNKTTKDLAPNYAQFSQAPHQGISKATFLLFKCEKCCRERFTSADQLIKLVWFIEQKSKENIEWQHLPVNQMYIKVAIKFQRFQCKDVFPKISSSLELDKNGFSSLRLRSFSKEIYY